MLSTVTDHPTDRVDDGDAAAAADGGGGDEGDICHPLQSRLWSYLSIIILRPIESHFPKCLHIISTHLFLPLSEFLLYSMTTAALRGIAQRTYNL